MDKFSALGDPNRRRIVELLAKHGPMTATEICEQFSVSPSAISQHLKILREANLILMNKKAQQRIYEINPQEMREMENWANRLASLFAMWVEALDKNIVGGKERS